MKTKNTVLHQICYFCRCILMSFWVSSEGSLKERQIRGGGSRNRLIIYYIPNAGSRNVCGFFFSFPFRGSLHITWWVSRDSVKGSFPLAALQRKKKGRTVLQLKLLTCTTLFPCWIFLFSAATVKTKWVVRFTVFEHSSILKPRKYCINLKSCRVFFSIDAKCIAVKYFKLAV